MHHLLIRSKAALENQGYHIVEGSTLWTNDKCVSASPEVRASELEQFLLDNRVHAVIPPWGGEFLMELLPLLDWERLRSLPPKWILGYSDISTLTFTYTLLTGHATAHGTNYIDLGSVTLDATTVRWADVLGIEAGGCIKQTSSPLYRSSWEVPEPDTPTKWSILGSEDGAVHFSGRLIGGCLDTLSNLLGTRYAPVERFIQSFCADAGVLWYLESCEMNAADMYRHLWQMRECGWFQHTNGFIMGRAAGYSDVKNFEMIDALHRIFDPLHIPVIYNADIGHVPPQITLVNGALADVSCSAGQGEITIRFA